MKGRDAILPLENSQVFVACVWYSLVEQFVEVVMVAGEEVHGACVEGEAKGFIGLGDWEDVEVKGIGDDPGLVDDLLIVLGEHLKEGESELQRNKLVDGLALLLVPLLGLLNAYLLSQQWTGWSPTMS